MSSNSIELSWNSVSGATGYNIYRATNSSGSYTYVGHSYSTSHTDTGLSANTTYYYKVAAYNDNEESAQSSYTSATTNSSSGGYEPGDPSGGGGSSPSSAIELYPGSEVSGTVSYYGPEEVWYRVTGSSGYYVWGNSVPGVSVSVYESGVGDMKNISEFVVGTSGGEYPLPASGTYYIRVSSYSDYATYSIGVSSYY